MLTSTRRPIASFFVLTALALVPLIASADPPSATKGPGRSSFESITLESGLTQDPGFAAWAADAGAGAPSGPTTGDPIAVTTGVTSSTSFASWAAELIVALTNFVGMRR